MRHRIEAQEQARLPGARPVVVEHGRGEEPQVDEVTQDVLQVAEVHRERGDDEGQPHGQDELHEDGQGQEQRAGREPAVQDQAQDEDGQAEQEMREVRQHRDHGQDLGREHHFLDERAAGDEHARGLEQ